MNLDLRRLSILCIAWTILALGCTSTRTTPLCDGFKSYETVKAVRSRIGQQGNGPWREESRSLGPPDPRPPYQFIVLSGPFRQSGIEGNLTLTFYNDRLLSTEFSTAKGLEYLVALRQQHNKMPTAAREEVITSGRTRFRYFIDADGTYRFLWFDPKLEDEWLRWVWQHA